MDKKKIQAMAYLAFGYAKHRVRRLFKKKDAQLAEFVEEFAEDGVYPLRVRQSELVKESARCLFCAQICESVCPALAVPEGVGFRGPMHIATVFSRGLIDLEKAMPGMEACVECQNCVDACPEDISIVEIKHFAGGVDRGLAVPREEMKAPRGGRSMKEAFFGKKIAVAITRMVDREGARRRIGELLPESSEIPLSKAMPVFVGREGEVNSAIARRVLEEARDLAADALVVTSRGVKGALRRFRKKDDPEILELSEVFESS
ncbi:MAG: 4Fe-4S dicluster domain-containing protein [Planctomycetes bacterium]|nr:4Fe-4S dicluster domain-containing protein [Planctomycetota bacterium]